MADKRLKIAGSSLFGPAGSATTDKRIKIAQSNLYGPQDKRVLIAQSTLVAPPKDLRVLIAQSSLAGPRSTIQPTYLMTANGLVPVYFYIGDGVSWQPVG